jgi:dCTP deaminase
MAILSGLELRRLIEGGQIQLRSRDDRRPFDKDAQVTEDAIDLRLYDKGWVVRDNVDCIDPTPDKFDTEAVFEEVTIPSDGYVLEHGEVLYTNTLDVVSLPDNLAGRVSTRSTFARLGLSVHVTHPKLGVGHEQAIPLQLVNHNHADLVIYPFTPYAQLQIEQVTGPAVPYRGKYYQEEDYKGPLLVSRDQQIIRDGRTMQLIQQEMIHREDLIRLRLEEYRRDLETMADKAEKKRGEGELIRESDIEMVNIPKKRVDMLQAVLYTLGGIVLAWGLSIVVEGSTLDRWKVTALVATVFSGLVFFIVAFFLQYYES